MALLSLSQKIRIQYYILRLVMKRHKQKSALVMISFSTLVIGFYAFLQFFPLTQDTVFTEGMVGQYQENNLPKNVENLASLGLTRITDNGEATPSAAKRWEVLDNGENGMQYNFYLRDDLYWHDGSKFSAHDLNYLFEGVQTTVVSDYEIHFKLKTPYAPFPTVLAKPLLKGSQLAGLGSYKITKIEKSQDYLTAVYLEKAKQSLFFADISNSIPKNATKIVFRFYPTASDLMTAYKLGELKAVYGFFDPESLVTWKNAALYKRVAHSSVVSLLFNTREGALTEKGIRQALSYAIPRDVLPGEEAFSPIEPQSWAYNTDVKHYVFDINHAIDLLKKSEGGKVPLNNTEKMTLTTTPPNAAFGTIIVDSWKKLGFDAKLVVTPSVPSSYQALLIRQEIPPDPDQYALWHSLQKESNLSGYANTRVDKLLEDGRKIIDKKERQKKYLDFQRFLVEDTPATFLYYPNEVLVINKRFDQPFFKYINGFSN